MDYQEAIEYLFTSAPLFQQVGAGAYKEGLGNTHTLDCHFGHPHRSYRTIHVGGTNGKGSTSHTLAAILQAAGYKVGLYTSPHLVDFRERIRVNGKMIPEERVVRFVQEERAFFEPLHPSFFELATALAFKHFEEEHVDWAVIEVGLGGRLDCTNIISPELSIVTNISKDHVQFLGDTLEQIALEKAGIIKAGVPVVIGERSGVADVFTRKAEEAGAPIVFAEDCEPWTEVEAELQGDCQTRNTATILAASYMLGLPEEAVKEGFRTVVERTGLMGRWQTVCQQPTVVCDTGHNTGAWQYLGPRLAHIANERQLHIVVGMVNDKDIDGVLSLMPRDAIYYFTQASVPRAMPASDFASKAAAHGLHGQPYPTVSGAYAAALTASAHEAFIFVGGSTFVVADLLRAIL